MERESGNPALSSAVAEGRFDELDPRTRALCEYAIKLTLEPWNVERDDVEALRAAGFDDRAIVDANQAASYFNYVNRVADGLGVELEPQWPEEVRAERSYPIRGSRHEPDE
ncbi:MAG: peroxidase [Actinomycetota bacterium]|nr:peroxidase [Actinomycetota bacterium]